MRNLLFFDIDGTLITDDDRRIFPADAKAALSAARSAGNLTFINTGRVRCNVESFITDAGFDGLVCGCGTYIEYHGEVLHHRKISREKCHELALMCREARIQGIFEAAHITSYDKKLDMPYIQSLVEYMESIGNRLIDDIDSEEFIFDKFAGWFDESSDLKRFRREIEKDFVYIDRGENFFEVEPIGYSKASGIQFLLDYFSLPAECTYAFGDSNNDLEMMQFSKHSVSMGKGSDACKEAAEFVTSDVEEGGIKRALEHFQLI